MHRFFVEPEQLNRDGIRITGEDYIHIRNVLRMKPGEELLLCDESDKEYLCQITGYNEKEEAVEVRVTDIFANTRELPVEITLFQGYPKGDKLETIVQKAVELGAARIVPVMMKRSIVKLDARKAEKKNARLNSIALSAAKQSRRGKIPEVMPVMSMKEAAAYARNMEYVIVPYEQAEGMAHSRKVIEDAVGKASVAVFIGPEGGFEPSEVEMIQAAGGRTISLGHRILRTETAGMTVLSLLMFQIEEDKPAERPEGTDI